MNPRQAIPALIASAYLLATPSQLAASDCSSDDQQAGQRLEGRLEFSQIRSNYYEYCTGGNWVWGYQNLVYVHYPEVCEDAENKTEADCHYRQNRDSAYIQYIPILRAKYIPRVCNVVYEGHFKDITMIYDNAQPGCSYDLNFKLDDGILNTVPLTASPTGVLSHTLTNLPVATYNANGTLNTNEVNVQDFWFERAGCGESCVPPTPPDRSNVDYPGELSVGNFTLTETETFDSSFPYPITITWVHWIRNGKLTGIQYTKTFEKFGDVRSSSTCGSGINTISYSEGSWLPDIAFALPIPFTNKIATAAWPKQPGAVWTVFDKDDAEPKEGFSKHGQVYKEYHKFDHALLSGEFETAKASNPRDIITFGTWSNRPVSFQQRKKFFGYTYTVCETECCSEK